MTELPRNHEELQKTVPRVAETLRLKGLDAVIEVFRDGYGIPHVRAGSIRDAFFGQGFATAQDRLWHMDYDRHRAYGRWAEYAGPMALEQDKVMRRFQLGLSARNDYATLNVETRDVLDSYAAGVNAFLESTETLPIEYRLVGSKPETWQPWDCLAVYKVRHIMMGVFEGKLWRARLVNTLGPEKAASLLRGYQPGQLLIVPPGALYDGPMLDGLRELSDGLQAISWLQEHAEAGSNSWVLAGSRTASGKPLLAGDPHRALDTPNVYYQNHIACPAFAAIGLSFPGFPGFPHFGHNRHVAWCVTHAGADYQDLYIERFRTDGGLAYAFRGEWRKAEVRHEVITVQGSEPVAMDVVVTEHGPVIVGDPPSGFGIAFKYTATAEPNHGFECILRMLTATSADELEESMREWVDPCNNFLFADVQGNIGYLTRGKIPIRSMANAWLPVPGWTGEYEWQGYIPFAELPRSRNPETGYIVTANNRIAGKDYPHYIALNFAPEYRARRITERLKPLQAASVADMAAIHADRVSIPAQVYAQLLAEVTPLDEPSAQAKAKLAGWHGTMDRESVAPTIYSAFRLRLHRRILEHLVGPGLTQEMFKATGRGAPAHLRSLASWLVTQCQKRDVSLLPPGETWQTLAAQALAEGVADLTAQLGANMESWQWGRVHQVKPHHTLSATFPEIAALLDLPAMPMHGDGDTPLASDYSPGSPFTVTSLSVARYVFDLSNWDNCRWVVPLGASGHPGSPHYADQASIWNEPQLIPMLFDWKRIGAEATVSDTPA